MPMTRKTSFLAGLLASALVCISAFAELALRTTGAALVPLTNIQIVAIAVAGFVVGAGFWALALDEWLSESGHEHA